MDASVVTLMAGIALATGAWRLGCRLGAGRPSRAWLAMVLAVAILGLWAWLTWNPAVAVAAIPVGVLSRIEGIVPAPLFALVLGVAWARSVHGRQRAVVTAAIVVGIVHFARSNGWMLQSAPAAGLAATVAHDVVLQSQDYTCVAAASAMALNRLGIYTSEAEMAALTQTRPGAGATLVRAMDGIRRRLQGTGWDVSLLQPTYEQLTALPMPVLATVRAGPLQRHMVLVEQADRHRTWVVDPAGGRLLLDARDFAADFSNLAIVIHRR